MPTPSNTDAHSSFGRVIPVANGLLLLCLYLAMEDATDEAIAAGSWALAVILAVAIASCVAISLKRARPGMAVVMAVAAFFGMLTTFSGASALGFPTGFLATAWIQLTLVCAWGARALAQQLAGPAHRKPDNPRHPKGSDENGAVV